MNHLALNTCTKRNSRKRQHSECTHKYRYLKPAAENKIWCLADLQHRSYTSCCVWLLHCHEFCVAAKQRKGSQLKRRSLDCQDTTQTERQQNIGRQERERESTPRLCYADLLQDPNPRDSYTHTSILIINKVQIYICNNKIPEMYYTQQQQQK